MICVLDRQILILISYTGQAFHINVKNIFVGTIAFLRSISLEAVALGVHLAAGAHDFLLQAEYSLSSIPSSVAQPVKEKSKTGARSNQPKDAQQGIQQVKCQNIQNNMLLYVVTCYSCVERPSNEHHMSNLELLLANFDLMYVYQYHQTY